MVWSIWETVQWSGPHNVVNTVMESCKGCVVPDTLPELFGESGMQKLANPDFVYFFNKNIGVYPLIQCIHWEYALCKHYNQQFSFTYFAFIIIILYLSDTKKKQ